jgi:hypothetical protein
MKENNLNTQHTLYRMVSLRNPEKLKKEKQELRFVIYFEEKNEIQNTGLFYKAVKKRPDSQTKWQALLAETDSFKQNAFTTENDVAQDNQDFFNISDWIAKNRTTATPNEILKKLDGLEKLDIPTEVNLWDNLFFTVITDSNHYVKEAIMQMLVLQNILKQSPTVDTIIALANANVVLPIEIFEEDAQTTSNSNNQKKETISNLVPQSLLKAQEIEKAKVEIDVITQLKKSIKKFEENQRAQFQKEHQEANKAYQKQIKPILDKYSANYAAEKFRLETLAQTDKDVNVNLINIPYPDVPEFEYDVPEEIDAKKIQEKLSKSENKKIEELINWEEISNFQELYGVLDASLHNANDKIITLTPTKKLFASFGDMVFPVSTNPSNNDLAYRICTYDQKGYASMLMTIQIPDSTYDVQAIEYNLEYNTQNKPVFDSESNTICTRSINSDILTIGNFFNNTLHYDNYDHASKFYGTIKFLNGQSFSFSLEPFQPIGCYSGVLQPTKEAEASQTNATHPKGFGFRQIGIADYKKVVTEICGYRAGEVAHIENIMAGETREKVTTKTHISEVTDTTSTEIETEKLSDTTSTERFEMQTEIAKMQQEQTALDAHANVHAEGVAWSLDAGANYATNTSKEESNRQAVTQAKEQTQRAMERIVSRIKTSKTVKITDEFVEANKHRFENLTNPNNVSGVYRFINAVYKNQIYNYGKRLMYEFMIPQPSKLHRLGLQVSVANNDATLLSKPTDPRIAFPSFDAINQNNYKELIATYEAPEVSTYPNQYKTIGKSFEYSSQTSNTANTKVDVIRINDDKYISKKVQIKFSGAAPGNNTGWGKNTMVTVGDTTINFQPPSGFQDSGILIIKEFQQEVPIAIWSTNYLTVNVTINIICELSQEAIINWQKATYEAILKGYNTKLTAYNEQLASIKAEGVALLDSNPLFYRDTEQLILRKNCISYLIDNSNTTSARRFGLEMYNDGATFENHQVTISKTMDDYTSFAKFMEQAFEWNLMSYNFYPFYWGNNAEWKDLYQFETNDPTYRSFMQAGMARVIVTVKPGFESAVMHYMAFGQIWNGGQTPILGNPLYLSIVDELKEQEYYIEDVWETVVPTNLVALQEKGVSIAGGGLPNADSCIEHKDVSILSNDKTIAVTEAPISN